MRKRGSDCSEVCKYLMLPILPGSISLKVFGLASLSGRHQRQKPFTVYDTAVNYECRLTYSRSRLLRGHARDILPPLSPSQPEIADDNITCWGTVLSFFAFFEQGTCMRRPGWYPRAWKSWHLQVVGLPLKSWTSPLQSFAFCSILPCERA